MTFKDYLEKLKNKRVAVIGAGISNMPLISALLLAGVETTIRDMRTREEMREAAARFEKQGAMLRLGDGYLDNLTEDIIFRTPGLMPRNPALVDAVKRGAVLTSEMEVFFEVCPCKTIAITGSDGKTTTTSIIAELLKNAGKTAYIGGNIGMPLLCKADDMQPEDFAVVELSSFQLITMKKSPDIAVVTNLSPNHLDIHSDMNEYITAKSNIYLHQKKINRAVFNLDNEITRELAKNAPADEVLFFSRYDKTNKGVYLENGTIIESGNGITAPIMQAKDILLPGIHNVENYMAAFAAVSGIVGHDVMHETAKSFRGVEHRIEFVRELRGVRYYNDSIASSPSRAIAGIRALGEGSLVLIAGGKDKGIPFDELGVEIVKNVKTLVLTGVAASQINEAVLSALEHTASDTERAANNKLEIFHHDDFNEAIYTASKAAKDGDIVLLSPACTSFDMFKNFEERGNKFKEIVNGLE
ncbi:MAG: UDP-N-acetylmuramoyl-L-alanine--D-glutamate ligase [Oscillospiraceae bacterium]|nr:UDP-N-acetylmuramoyl-L-alanine--D-glutamate ligase [Oscillospiraceae bacterium]